MQTEDRRGRSYGTEWAPLMKWATDLVILIVSFVLLCMAAPVASAQNPDDLMPAASAAKARAILQQTITALGGSAYLELRNTDCTGRAAQFEHSGAVGGYLEFHDYRELPDKVRQEYDKKGIIVDIYTAIKGWSLDRGGVSELPADAIAAYREQLKTDLNTILRTRMNDDTLTFRYAGTDVVDLKNADWIEIDDREGHTIRVAIDKSTHLPIRSVVGSRDPETRDRIEKSSFYSNYHPIDGVQTPFQTAQFRNGQQTFQVFYEGCQYNQNLSPDLFTRASLDEHFAQVHKKDRNARKK